mgnify:CR=1 FL=1
MALLFFLALSAVETLDKRLPLADAALVDAKLVDAAVLAVADATARRSSAPPPSPNESLFPSSSNRFVGSLTNTKNGSIRLNSY